MAMSDDYSRALEIITDASHKADVANDHLRNGRLGDAQKRLDESFDTLTSSFSHIDRLYDDEYENAIRTHVDVHGKLADVFAALGRARMADDGGAAAQ